MEIIKKSMLRQYTFLMWIMTMFLVAMLFKAENAWTQPSIARTADSYAWDMTDAAMDSVCQSNFGTSYKLATWDQVVAYVQEFGLNEFYAQTGMTEYRSKGWLRGFYSSSRRYFAERHDGNVPYDWLVHAQIGNHDIDLGSWYNSRPILCYYPDSDADDHGSDLDDDLVAYYPFNGNANDESGNGNNGVVNGAILTQDRFGTPDSAYSFDGVDDFIDIGNNVKPSYPITVSAWVNVNSLNDNMAVFRNDLINSSGQGYYGIRVLIRSDGGVSGFYGDCGYAAGWSRQTKYTDGSIIMPGQWHHITIIFNGHLDMDIYVDGIERDSYWKSDGSGGSLCYSGSHSGAIGDQYNSYWFDGFIDDIRVYNRSLSENEILSMLNCGDEKKWMPINGKIRYHNTSLCAMILANGQYMFTCGNDLGIYDFLVPTDDYCDITLYAFTAGFTPFKVVLKPWEAVDYNIEMSRASDTIQEIDIDYQAEADPLKPGWVKISGIVSSGWTPLCAMILANGQYMFTCGDNVGNFELSAPLDQNGKITLYGFCSGFAPYKISFEP